MFSIVQHIKVSDFQRKMHLCEFILLGSSEDIFFLILLEVATIGSTYMLINLKKFQNSWQFHVYCAIRNNGDV